jgi:hypothetical protein
MRKLRLILLHVAIAFRLRFHSPTEGLLYETFIVEDFSCIRSTWIAAGFETPEDALRTPFDFETGPAE